MSIDIEQRKINAEHVINALGTSMNEDNLFDTIDNDLNTDHCADTNVIDRYIKNKKHIELLWLSIVCDEDFSFSNEQKKKIYDEYNEVEKSLTDDIKEKMIKTMENFNDIIKNDETIDKEFKNILTKDLNNKLSVLIKRKRKPFVVGGNVQNGGEVTMIVGGIFFCIVFIRAFYHASQPIKRGLVRHGEYLGGNRKRKSRRNKKSKKSRKTRKSRKGKKSRRSKK